VPIFENEVNRFPPLSKINDSLLPDAMVKILGNTFPTAVDLQHWKSILLTDPIGVFHHRLLREPSEPARVLS
jgi:hypothetical protein